MNKLYVCQLFLSIFMGLLITSCTSDSEKFVGFWVEKNKQKKVLHITKQQQNFLVDFYGEKRVPAKLEDGLFNISIFNKTISAIIDDNDLLVLSDSGTDNEYIRLEKSKNFKIVEFRDCKLQPIDNNGDDMQIIFSDLNPFPARQKKKMKIELCINDSNGNLIPNPKYLNKKFVIRWENENSMLMKPIIKYIKQIE